MAEYQPLSAAQEAEIQKRIASDPDAPEASDAELAAGTPFAQAFPELMQAIVRSRGRPVLDAPKQQISLRLDPQVIEALKATGKGWQGRVNEILKKAVGL